jgi:hypothetical protein
MTIYQELAKVAWILYHSEQIPRDIAEEDFAQRLEEAFNPLLSKESTEKMHE